MTGLKEELSALKIDQSERGGGGRRGIWIALVALLAVAVAGGWFWTTRLQAASVKVAAVESVGVGSSGGAGTVLNASGYVTARRRATISSKITGKIVEVNVEEGMAVTEGQILARLDDSTARAALELANRLSVRWAVDELLGLAVRQLRVARAALANPATLPRTFRN